MMQQQANHLVRCERIPVAIRPCPRRGPRHPVRDETNIMRDGFLQIGLAGDIILFDRLGIDAAKQNVVVCIGES